MFYLYSCKYDKKCIMSILINEKSSFTMKYIVEYDMIYVLIGIGRHRKYVRKRKQRFRSKW